MLAEDAFEGIFPGLVHGFYEITDSDWNARLTEQNQITFPDKRIGFNRRHFLMTCKESTLQVLASELVVQLFTRRSPSRRRRGHPAESAATAARPC